MLHGHGPPFVGQTMPPVVFRPALGLRIICLSLAVICIWAVTWQVAGTAVLDALPATGAGTMPAAGGVSTSAGAEPPADGQAVTRGSGPEEPPPTARTVSRDGPRQLAAALIVALPCLLAAVVHRRRIVVREEGLVSTGLLRSRSIPWGSVRRVDQTRTSFVVVTGVGSVSAGLIAPGDRDRLLRLILEKARLIASPNKLRWGLVMQYVPRTQPISMTDFQPHNRRKPGS